MLATLVPPLLLLPLASGPAAVDFNRDPCNVLFNFSHLPQCDTGLSARERSAALAAAMTTGQKISFVGGGYQTSMPTLGIPLVQWSDGIFMSISNNWLGAAQTQNLSKWAPFPTVLPGPMTMAASFDLDLVARAATMVSDEARSLNNDMSPHYGLVGTIVMNTCRDPRWGRCQEGYGECPFLSAEMVRTYIRGIQGPPDAKYLKIATDSKHLAVHTGPESPNNARRENRLGFDSVVSQRAIYEHFLPPFRAAAEAGTSSFMCSCACDHHHHHQQLLRLSLSFPGLTPVCWVCRTHADNAINGVPSCANPWLLTSIARDFWNRSDMTIQSDCGTLTYMTDDHHFTDSGAEAAADFFNAGGNTVCGGVGTGAAISSGLLSEAVLTERVTEALVPMFRLGAFDSPGDVEWKDLSKYNKSIVGTPAHTAIAREAAQKGVVLLENRNQTLPLKPSEWVGRTILVTGPHSGNETEYPGGFCFGDSR
jgi:beta-glucosidase-like glycosyl hydrolase